MVDKSTFTDQLLPNAEDYITKTKRISKTIVVWLSFIVDTISWSFSFAYQF